MLLIRRSTRASQATVMGGPAADRVSFSHHLLADYTCSVVANQFGGRVQQWVGCVSVRK